MYGALKSEPILIPLSPLYTAKEEALFFLSFFLFFFFPPFRTEETVVWFSLKARQVIGDLSFAAGNERAKWIGPRQRHVIDRPRYYTMLLQPGFFLSFSSPAYFLWGQFLMQYVVGENLAVLK